MTARIRALLAMWAVVGLVVPPPASAQAGAAQSGADASAKRFSAPDGGTLSLSLDEAVARALENNTDVAVERFNPELSAQDVRGAQGFYDPFVFAQLSKNSVDSEGTNLFAGGATINTKQDVWNFGVQQELPTGGTFSVGFDNFRRNTTNIFSTFNPVYDAGLNLNLTQPLLRNLGIDAPRLQLRIAKKNREITDVQFRQTIINTAAVVKGYYYDLIFAIDNLAAAQKNLQLAQRLLEENEIRVKVGTMAPLDVVTAQSEVASREEGVIVAENALAEAEDLLKSAIFPQNDPNMWRTRIVPTDRPQADPLPVDIDAAVQNALANRTDVIAARKSLENADYRLSYARNQLRPQLDLVAGYGGSGVSGTRVRDEEGNPLPQPVPGGYGDAVSEVFGFDFPSWTVGFNVSYVIPNRTAKANAASAQLTREQQIASLRRLELQVAAEVRSAARGVESGFKRVASSQAARRLASERLDAEEKKFAAGMSTNFFVTQAQRDLADAEVSELRAIADYRKSVINYQRVQEAGVGGSGASVILSGQASNAQAAQAIRSGAAGAGSNGGNQF
jgi:outer membrane protein TolC